DHRVEDSVGQLANVNRHEAAPGSGTKVWCWSGGGAGARRRSACPRATHLVPDLVAGPAHRDARGAAELNHDLQGRPFRTEIPPQRSGISSLWAKLIRSTHAQVCQSI